jgi:hypothetical protein
VQRRAAVAAAASPPSLGTQAPPGGNAAPAARAGGGGGGGPLDLLATQLGIAGKGVVTPAVPLFGWVPVEIPQVWLAAFGLLLCFATFTRPGSNIGWRVVGGGVLALCAYVHVVSTGRVPAAAAPTQQQRADQQRR